MLGDKLKHSGFVTIIGIPNVGKSTFLNKVIGQKVSIVTPKAQTTRNQIRGILTQEDSQIIFIDTPGITKGNFGKLLNKWMNRYSISSTKDADLILFFVDISTQHPELGIGEEEKNILTKIPQNKKTILVANKTDLVKPMRAEDTIAVYKKHFNFFETYKISAETGDGIDILLKKIKENIPEGPQYFPEDYFSDQEPNFMASEIIREKVFLYLRQELPYSTAITVDNLRNHKTRDLLLIDATIHVSRKSHKGMIIGKKGTTLGKIGKTAREELEDLFERKIGLKLFVRIEEKWQEKENLLKKVGFQKDFE